MDYLKINNLLYEYFYRDEEGDVEGINTALCDVNLSVKQGDFVSILGHNGSGKSTLAKLINALLVPAEGSVIVDGMDTKDSELTLEIRKNTGMVFQNPDNQIVAGVVEEDVAFGPENLGVEPEKIRSRVKKALSSLNMWDVRKKSPNHLSGGQKQRVAISGILAMEPKCIVLDEATSMLDPVGRRDVINTVRSLNRDMGITIIQITHNMEETVFSDRIFVMDKGKLILSGTPLYVYSRGDFLLEHGLDIPGAVRISNMLRDRGIPIDNGVLTMQDLVKNIEGIKNGNYR